MSDLPKGYRWATEDETDRDDAISVKRTVDSQGNPYTGDEADLAVPTVRHVTVADPDDPFGSPAYDGPEDQAHTRLAAGIYVTTDPEVAVAVYRSPEGWASRSLVGRSAMAAMTAEYLNLGVKDAEEADQSTVSGIRFPVDGVNVPLTEQELKDVLYGNRVLAIPIPDADDPTGEPVTVVFIRRKDKPESAVELICPARDWEHPLVGFSYCIKPPNHEGDHEFRYDAR